MQTDIKSLRKEIELTDNKIINLIKSRSIIALKIAKYKFKNNLKILDKNREKEILEKYTKKFKNIDEKYVVNIFKSLFRYSKELQKRQYRK